jgi:hypothetical protein
MVQRRIMPDGRRIDFPDGMSKAQIDIEMRARTDPAYAAAIGDARRRVATAPPVYRAVSQGFTANQSDELEAGTAALETGLRNLAARTGVVEPAPYGRKTAFEAVMDAEKEASDAALPTTNVVGGWIGAFANPVGKRGAKWVGDAGDVYQATGRSGAVGTATGLLTGYGAGRSQAEREQGALNDGLVGGTVGIVAPGLERAAKQSGMNSFLQKVAPAPTSVFYRLANTAAVPLRQAGASLKPVGEALTPDLGKGVDALKAIQQEQEKERERARRR